MSENRFQAGTKYNDFLGSAAADVSDTHTLAKFLREAGTMTDQEHIIGVRFSVGENFEGRANEPRIQAFVTDRNLADGAHLDEMLVFRTVNVDVGATEFIGFFKRFEIVITRNGLNLNGRHFRVEQSE